MNSSSCNTMSENKNNLPLHDPDEAWRILSQTQPFLPIPTTTAAHNPMKSTRISCMSDTHGKHRKVFIPKCDVLIHGGDFTKSGEQLIIKDLADFFAETVQEGRTKKVICIAGNHDISFHPECCHRNWGRFHPMSTITKMDDAMKSKIYLKERCTYLEDESITENNIHFHGSPWSPTFCNRWAFMKSRDTIHSQWDLIPNETDVLVTHGPPLGRGDKVQFGKRAGCLNLLGQVQDRIKPRLHVFGHIHEDKGCTFDGDTLYVNASNCTIRYLPEQPCIVVDLPHDVREPARFVVPNCVLAGNDVLNWLKMHGYDKIYPYFENRKPLLDGSELVCDEGDLLVENLACKLKMHSFKVPLQVPVNWRDLQEELTMAMLHLRNESY